MKWYRQPAALLLILLASTSLVMTAAGLTIKHTVAKSSEQIQNTMAIVVPFLLLRGDVVLLADAPPAKEPPAEPEVEPEPEAVPVIPPEVEGLEVEVEEAPWEIPRNYVAVEEGYFDTALFIGDSRTVGLAHYGRLGDADYFADVGMSTFNLFSKSVSDEGFAAQDLHTLLQSKEYETIYIMLGINELGYPLESIEKQFDSILEEICTLQPDAVIVLEANLGITRDKEARSSNLSMERIRVVNDIIKARADDQRIFFLDANTHFADESGYLQPEVTSDGAHPYASEYRNWAIWMKGYGLEEVVK